MDKDEYTNSLENLLIFMCQTYDANEKELLGLEKQGNDAFFRTSRIQGTLNTVRIAQLAKLEFHRPKHSFKNVLDEILRKRACDV